jgi:hypothetical protein
MSSKAPTPIPVNILDILEAEAKRACARCAQGDAATPDDIGEYSHGCDDFRPPEPCDASSLWRVAELLHRHLLLRHLRPRSRLA